MGGGARPWRPRPSPRSSLRKPFPCLCLLILGTLGPVGVEFCLPQTYMETLTPMISGLEVGSLHDGDAVSEDEVSLEEGEPLTDDDCCP